MTVRITMIGAGYVGLVTGVCFAELGHDVICVDTDKRKIDMLRGGKIPIYEPGLDQLFARNVANGRLRFSLDPGASVKGRDAVFIAVGTPEDKATGRADLSYVFAAAREIGAAIDSFTVVITKSTVPVGTNLAIEKLLLEMGKAGSFGVASNPEFLREGAAIADFMEPDRVVVGCDDRRTAVMMERIYAPLSARNTPFLFTDVETAEMIKYTANAFLAVKVSFINEIADLCEKIGAKVDDVAKGIGMDRRIGAAFLRVGPGWGGSCFPKDTMALQMTARDNDVPLRIVSSAIEANALRKSQMADRIIAACGGSVAGKTIGVLGLTFKGQTDDMRDSPSLVIIPLLQEAGAIVKAYDPSDPREAPLLLPGVHFMKTPEETADGAEALVVMTDWFVFRSYDLAQLAAMMGQRRMIDLRNLFSESEAASAGFDMYFNLGSPQGGAELRRSGELASG